MRGTMISFAWIVTFQKFSSLQNVRCLSLSRFQQLCKVSNLAAFFHSAFSPENGCLQGRTSAVRRIRKCFWPYGENSKTDPRTKMRWQSEGASYVCLAFLWKNPCFREEVYVFACVRACVHVCTCVHMFGGGVYSMLKNSQYGDHFQNHK